MTDYTTPADLLTQIGNHRRTSTPGPVTEGQAMGALDHMSQIWTMTCTDGQVFVVVTGQIGPLSFAGRTRKDALNSALHALRAQRALSEPVQDVAKNERTDAV